MKKVTRKLFSLILAVALVAALAVPAFAQPVYAAEEGQTEETDSRIAYGGTEVGFYKEDGTTPMGMLSRQEGSKEVVDGDQVLIYYVSKNKTTYNGMHWGLITDAELTKDESALESGCWEFAVDTDNCGYGIPVAPIKAKDGLTTGDQYYLCIPALDKLKAIADYSGVNAALTAVPEDLSGYTEASVQAVDEAVAATKAEDFGFYNVDEQETVDNVAKAINEAVAGLEKIPDTVALEDGAYVLSELSAGPSSMFNHFVDGSKYLIVNGDTATVRFITDGSTASVQKYSRIALGKSSELVTSPYQQDEDLPEGTKIIEGVLQPQDGSNTDKYLFEIPLTKTEAEALLANDIVEDIYVTVWNKTGSSTDKIPGWYQASKDIYLNLGSLGEKTEAPVNAESFGFTLQVGQYTEGADFHTASFDGVTYTLKDEGGNEYAPSSTSVGSLSYRNLDASKTYTFTASKEGWTVVTQGEWNVDAHAYEYIYTGKDEINVTITKADDGKNISEHTNPGMIFRISPREENIVDQALASVPEGLNYDLFTDSSANALKAAVEAADPTVSDETQLNEMAAAITTALESLVPKDGTYEVAITKYNSTPYYLYEGLGDSDKNNGKAVLVVEGGKMTANIVFKNQSYGQMTLGTKDEVMAAATEAGAVPEGTIDLTLPEDKATYNGKEYSIATGTIPVPALQKQIAYAVHSSNTKYTYNTGWYDHAVMFLANSLTPLAEETGITNLSIYDEELMFKVVNAYLEKSADKTELVFALSGAGYENIFAGTFDEAIANGTNKENWIGYTTATVECIYDTRSGTQDDGVAEKYQFRIPVTLDESGITRIPIVAISKTRVEKAEAADPENPDYSSAFTARQIVLDINAKSIRTGNYQDTIPATVTSNVESLKVESDGEIFTIGTPAANEYTCQGTFTLSDQTYDAYFKGYAEDASAASEGISEIGDDGVVTLKYQNSLGKTPEINVATNKVNVAFRNAATQEWVGCEIKIDPVAKAITIKEKGADEAAADKVQDLTSDLPGDAAGVDDIASVNAAREAYNNLTEDQKAQVSDEAKAKLEAAETAVANAVADQLSALPGSDATAADKEKVEAARTLYESLSAEAKAKVSAEALSKLTDAETAVKAAEETPGEEPGKEDPQSLKAQKVKVSKTSYTLVVSGGTVSLKTKSSASGAKITYKSSNTKVAKVSAKGVITPVKAGTAKITVTAEKAGYKKATTTVTVKVTGLKKGASKKVGKATYKVTGKNTVAYVKSNAAKSVKSISVPATVKINKATYKVTKINANAMKGRAKLTKVTIGKNVMSIGKQAFKGDKKLKTVIIKGTNVKTFGKQAFKGIAAKATFKLPKKTFKKYKAAIKKVGAPKKAIYKKQ